MFSKDGENFMPEEVEAAEREERLTELLLQNFDSLAKHEKALLLERVKRANDVSQTQEETITALEAELERALYMTSRHGLSYRKLFHNSEGGYDLERLKTVLKRVKQDREDGLHPYIDPALDAELSKKLKKVLRLNIDSKQEGVAEGDGEAEEAASGSDGEEGATFSL